MQVRIRTAKFSNFAVRILIMKYIFSIFKVILFKLQESYTYRRR